MHFIATNMHFTFNALNVFVYSDVVMHFEVKWILLALVIGRVIVTKKIVL